MFRWCILSVSLLTLQPACFALVLGQTHGTVSDTIGSQPLPAPSSTSAMQVADASAPLRPEEKIEGRWLPSLSAAPLNASDKGLKATASNAKLESHRSEASFESAFPGWGDIVGLQRLPAPSSISTGQVADVSARPEEKMEGRWLTSLSVAPWNVLDTALKATVWSTELESPRSVVAFEHVFPEWAQLLLAEISILIGILLTYFWLSSPPPAADALTQFEKISFDSDRN